MKISKVMFAVLIALTMNMTFAYGVEAKIITGRAEYYIEKGKKSEIEKVALESAKREALEQAGVYIESESLVKNNALKKDAVKAITIGTTRLVKNSVNKQYTNENGKEKLTLVAQFDIDEKEVSENIKRITEQAGLLSIFEQEMNSYTEELLKYEYLKAVNDFNLDQDESLLTEQEKEYLIEYMQLGTADGLQMCNSYAYTAYVYGKYKRAEQIYKIIIDYSSNLKWTDGTEKNFYGYMYERLAEMRMKMKDYAGAEVYIDKALAYDAERSKAMIQKLEILEGKGVSIDEQLKYTEKMIKANYVAGNSSRALILIKVCRYKEALECLNKAISYIKFVPNPGKAEVEALSVLYDNLGQVYEKISDYKNAEDSFKKGIELNPNNMNILNSLGCLYEKTQEYNKAYATFDKIIKYIPKNSHTDWDLQMQALAYFNRGNIATYLKKYDEALADYDKAKELDPYIENLYVMKEYAKKQKENR